jgi:hypothetical protein
MNDDSMIHISDRVSFLHIKEGFRHAQHWSICQLINAIFCLAVCACATIFNFLKLQTYNIASSADHTIFHRTQATGHVSFANEQLLFLLFINSHKGGRYWHYHACVVRSRTTTRAIIAHSHLRQKSKSHCSLHYRVPSSYSIDECSHESFRNERRPHHL